jgi:hypothetical protein
MAQVASTSDSLTSRSARTYCRQAIEVAAMRWLGWRSDSTIASRESALPRALVARESGSDA